MRGVTTSLVLVMAACSSGSGDPHTGGGGNILPSVDGGTPDAGCTGASCSVGPPDAGCTGASCSVGLPAGPPGGGDWAQYRNGNTGQSANPGIWDKAQAANLAQAWTFPIDPHEYLYSQPVIAGGMVILTTAIVGRVVALDAATGAALWARADLSAKVSTTCGGAKTVGFWSAPAVVGDTVYVAAPDGHAYALNRADGSTLWSVSLADGSAAGHGEFIQSSPSISTKFNRMYLGIASSMHCDLVRGKILSVDLTTHAAVVRPLVDAGQQGGGVWSSLSVDEPAGLVFASTGNRVGPAAAEPLSQSIVALDALTLAPVDHWQNPTPLENSDFGSSPTLFETAAGARLVAAANKDGWLYVLDRSALARGPVWKYQLAVIDPANPTAGGDPSAGFGSIVSPTFANGLLYAAGGRTPDGSDGSVVALDPATGAVAWRHLAPGYVMAAMPAVGDVLIVEASKTDNSASTLEVLDAKTGAVLRSLGPGLATYGAPSVGRGLLLWPQYSGTAVAYAVPAYR